MSQNTIRCPGCTFSGQPHFASCPVAVGMARPPLRWSLMSESSEDCANCGRMYSHHNDGFCPVQSTHIANEGGILGNSMTVESSYMIDSNPVNLHNRMAAVLQLIETSVDYKLLGVSVTSKFNGDGCCTRWQGHIFYRSTAGVIRS